MVTCLIIDHLYLVAALFGPAIVHALQHFGPVLTLGAASTRMDLDEAIIGVGFARQQCHDLVLVGTVGQCLECSRTLIAKRSVAFHFGQLDELDCPQFVGVDLAHCANRCIQPPPLAHHFFGGLGAVP